jgi:hypothetical protein
MSALFADERNGLANTANMSALIYDFTRIADAVA